ncbi:hypothetical protein C8R44DRAFT_239265, partial [Mycena epipterygia]
MHRGLCILEVVELICSVAEFPTLAALAQTCQIFQPPALSVLWSDQPDLLQLLKCLPSDLWEMTEVGAFAPATLRFRRPVVPSDWTRVLFYAVYVKTLVEESRLSVMAEIYAALSLSLPKHPLFPNIRHLTWRTRDDIFPYIRTLVGDKLKSIFLDFHGSDIIRSSLLLSLTTFHPKLTHLEIDVLITDSPMATPAIYSAICSWNHLEKLKFSSLDLPSMLHLARLPNLKYLHLYHFPSDAATLRQFQARVASTGPVFAALREFTAYSNPITLIADFLDVIDPDALDKIDLTIEAPNLTEEWQALTTSLARKSCKTLTKLSLTNIYSTEHDIPDALEHMLGTESIQPLLSFANLAQVTIGAAHGIDLDDAFLKRMALAWP